MIHICIARALSCLFTMVPAQAAPPPAEAPPNIVIILADDLGSGDLGSYNADSAIPTPHLDALALEGMRFTDAHSPSAVCTPTRYGILTGRYAWRTRLKRWVLNGSSPLLLDDGRPTMPGVLSDAGYTTIGVGKWHLGLGGDQPTDYGKPFDTGPLTVGFQAYEGIPASLDMEPYVWIVGDGLASPPSSELPASRHRRQGGGGFWRKGRASEDFDMQDVLPRIGRTACRMIREQAATSDPFLLYVPLTAPHTPWLPDEVHAGTSGAGHYGDFVAMVDTVVGSIITCLAESGVRENTLVVFTSDNGAHWPSEDIDTHGHAANLAFRGQKADIHEGGHRVPLIVRWPGRVTPGGVDGTTVCLTDLFPTVTAAAGARLPGQAAPDGVDLLPLLEGSGAPTDRRDAIVHHSGDGMFAIRQGPWKLIEGRGSGGFTRPARREIAEGDVTVQLYDLEADPSETTNLARTHPERVRMLLELLESIREADASVKRDR
ncbi:MAG: arylsulfatase [Phycisphaerales bacterium]|nr:arylsulfatase [Phycisphaerales bacterium]